MNSLYAFVSAMREINLRTRKSNPALPVSLTNHEKVEPNKAATRFGFHAFTLCVACVASVPVRANEIQVTRKRTVKKGKQGGGGGERRERLPANPLILKNAH